MQTEIIKIKKETGKNWNLKCLKEAVRDRNWERANHLINCLEVDDPSMFSRQDYYTSPPGGCTEIISN